MQTKNPEQSNRSGFGIGALAEGVGFEPTIRYNRIPDFESGAFDLSATLPRQRRIRILQHEFEKSKSRRKNLLLASPGLQQRIKVPKTILRPHSGIRTKQGAKHECFAPCPYDVVLSAGMRPPVWPDSAITSIRPDGEPRGRPCRDGALRAPSRSRRHSGSFRAPRRACDPRRDPSRSGCERSACALLRP